MNIFQLAGHLTFVLISISFLVKDILWLRSLSIVASLSSITFNYFVPATPLWLVIGWNTVFISINVFHVIRILRQRIGIRLSPEEQELYQNLFSAFATFEFVKLIRAGSWRFAEKETSLIKQGDHVDKVLLIYNGSVEIVVNNRSVACLRDGDFIGEMSFVSGRLATATARVTEPTRYVEWLPAELKNLLDRNPSMKIAMQSVISHDLTRKLETTGA